MVDTGVLFTSKIGIPVALALIIMLLFPFPDFLKKMITKPMFKTFYNSLALLSFMLFAYYLFDFYTFNLVATDNDSLEIRTKVLTKLLKAERNVLASGIHLTCWIIYFGANRWIRKINEVKDKKD